MIRFEANIGLNNEENITITNRNLTSLEVNFVDRTNPKLASYGIISNSGNIKFKDFFKDFNGKIKDYAQRNLLKDGFPCHILVIDTIKKKHQNVGFLRTKDWDYDNDNYIVSVSLKDDLEEWQNIFVSETNYNTQQNVGFTGQELYDYFYALTPQKYKMLEFSELDEETQNILSHTQVPYGYLKSGSLWQQWTKLCQVCALYIYQNFDGRTICRYDRGN